jgi:hypothetical protein
MCGLGRQRLTSSPAGAAAAGAAAAAAQLLPSLPDFLDRYDLDYRRYKQLLEAAQQQPAGSGASAGAAELQQLAVLYGAAYDREQRLQQQAQQVAQQLAQQQRPSPLAAYYPKNSRRQ